MSLLFFLHQVHFLSVVQERGTGSGYDVAGLESTRLNDYVVFAKIQCLDLSLFDSGALFIINENKVCFSLLPQETLSEGLQGQSTIGSPVSDSGINSKATSTDIPDLSAGNCSCSCTVTG